MEPKTSVAAVKPLPIYEENTKDFKDAKKTKKDMLLHLYHKEKHIFLYSVEESSVAPSTLGQGLENKYMEVILLPDIISKKMDEFDKRKSRLTPEGDTFVIDGIFEKNVLDRICKEPESHQDASIRAVCYIQVDDDKKKPLKSFHHCVMGWMKKNNKGYLEVSDRATGSDTRQGVTDTDEDSAPAYESEDLERYPFFCDPLFPWRDPKKSPELLYILNKIRRAQKCPEESLTEIYQATTSQSEEQHIDLEVDALHSDRQRNPLFLEGESRSQVHVSKKSESKHRIRLRNVDWMCIT